MSEENKQITDSELKHSIFNEAKKLGSLKDSVIQHAGTYGINQIEELLPEHKAMPAQTINNEVEWVNKLLGKVHKTPFARVKSLFVDITDATLRAKGYVKGKENKPNVYEMPMKSYAKGVKGFLKALCSWSVGLVYGILLLTAAIVGMISETKHIRKEELTGQKIVDLADIKNFSFFEKINLPINTNTIVPISIPSSVR